MIRPPVRSKQDMYRRLAAGEFGNTNPAFYSLKEWEDSPDRSGHSLWGIRSMVVGGPVRFEVPTAEVPGLIRSLFACMGFNLSAMVDPYLTFRGEVLRDFTGLRLYGVVGRREVKWRDAFRKLGREWRGAAALSVLETFLWPSDLEDVRELLDSYDGHVVEFTSCDRALGTVPHRNTVIWEVRAGDGSYERWLHPGVRKGG